VLKKRSALFAATLRLLGVCALLSSISSAAAQTPAPATIAAPQGPIGEWLVAKKVARIKIVDCDSRLWGVVSWEATPGTDAKNSDESLRGRPTLGMPILLGMKPNGPNKWEGDIYNSEDGHTYGANISMADPDTLKVQGCFLGFLCGGENWTRFQEPPAQQQAHQPVQPQQAVQSRAAGRASPPPVTDNSNVCASIPGATRPAH
jgi:uncharacterized protein (DUF2147 family)